MESNFYELQKQIWRLIRNQPVEIIELISTNRTERDTWIKFLDELYKKEETEIEPNVPEILTNEELNIEKKDMDAPLQKLKNRKSSGLENIANERLKYGGKKLNQQLTTLIRNIFSRHRIPGE